MALMSFWSNAVKAAQLIIYRRSVAVITVSTGIWVTLLVSALYWVILVFYEHVFTVLDFMLPLFIGGLFTLVAVGLFTKFFAKLEEDRRLYLQLRENESQLKSSLARTYIAIINQRDEAKKLSQEHARLRGSFSNEIQQRQATQAALDEQRIFNHAIIGLTPDIILFRDAKGKVIGANDNLLHLLKARHNAEVAKLLDVEGEAATAFNRGDQEVKESLKDLTYEVKIGSYVLQMRKRPALNATGKLIGIMCYGHDITELKHEQALIEQASQAKSNFISTLSHELRTPLNGIVGLSEILLGTNHFKDDDLRNLKSINVNAVTLGNIFNDVIDLNKFERRTFSIVSENVAWPDFLESLETLARLMAEQKSLSMDFKVEGQGFAYVVTDATRLRQMLWNLITNAVKFTSKGGIGILVKQHIKGNELVVEVTVKDSGIGIAKEEHDRIFELYYQVKGTKQATGTGIGLNVTKELCQAMGGSIELKSELGVGSEFTLHFTFKKGTSDEEKPAAAEGPLNILLVEDVDLNILVATSMLKGLGHTVTPAKTGAQAIEAFNAGNFDLVLLDMQLPDMTGLMVADELKKHKLVPMVALTANATHEYGEYQRHSVLDVITKPLSVKKLKEILSKYDIVQKHN